MTTKQPTLIEVQPDTSAANTIRMLAVALSKLLEWAEVQARMIAGYETQAEADLTEALLQDCRAALDAAEGKP